MSRTLPGIGLTGFWPLGFNGYNGDMDANLRIISALIGGSALSLVDADPATPADGDIHLLSHTHPTHPGTVAVRDAGAWVYIPVPQGKIMFDVGAAQHRQFDGTDWAVLATGGGGAPAGIGGVTLNMVTQLHTASLVATDSPYVAVSFWIKYSDAAAVINCMSYANDVASEYGIWHGNWSGGANNGKLGVVFEDEVGLAFERIVGPDVTAFGAWQHYLIVFKGAAAGGHFNQVAVYRDRVHLATVYDHDVATFVPTLNGKSFYVGSDSYAPSTPHNFEMAEFWLHTGTDLLESDGTVSDATLDKFVTADLKPVPLGADGSTPTGTPPTIFLHYDTSGSPNDFGTNLGTGGAFTLSSPLPASTTNPGD